ncbi:DUF2087 domain-containing protein [Anaerocolumna sedimenticola]|uniref:DUF2087 domain-containing protein n=1 Tax=Anaerocolumna sedimenticola TaxID=2696063 RepID=A0A6P1TT39_9FIRM|nr:DUF2087 domain-containing protein [Anaerocolumna sedimenticola]QHQ62886.1 DUF2087 domain-containing protein [Anaerocolumna sedimenticola]
MKSDYINIERFLDEDKKIKIWPAKRDLKIEILKYLSEKFETGVFYTEKEVNEIIKNWHTFSDFFLLRRGLIDMKYLSRTKDGLQYWKEENISNSLEVKHENY